MSSRITEAMVLRQIKKYLDSLPSSKFIKRPSSIARSGEPDITGSYRGRHVEIEVKAPGNKPTDLQVIRLREWVAAGAIAFWTDNVDKVKGILKEDV